MKALTELRDEFVKNIEKYEGTKKFDYYNEAVARLNGFDAAVDLLTKQGAADFDEEAASDEGYKLNFINAVDSLQNVAFVRGARYQHQQNSAALSAMKSELVVRNVVVIKQGDEIEKLRAENAILREELTNIVVGTLEARKVANETLTAADKVRGK